MEVCTGAAWTAIAASSSCTELGGCAGSPATSCQQIRAATPGAASGLFWLDPNGGGSNDAFQAYCDMTTDGGGWTLIARVSDTNGTAGDYEFRSISGGNRSMLNSTWSSGSPTQPQYALGLGSMFPAMSGFVDVQYYCYSSQQPSTTTYWVKAQTLPLATLVSNLESSSNPDFVMSGLSVVNMDGVTSTTGNLAMLARGTSGSATCGGNTYAGQTGIKYTCATGNQGQFVLSPKSVWFTTDYVGTNYGEVTSCGSNAGNSLPWYVGEIRVRAAIPGSRAEAPATSCQAAYNAGLRTSGTYWLDPNGGATNDAFQAWCDMTTDGGPSWAWPVYPASEYTT